MTPAEIREMFVRVMVDNLAAWRWQLTDLSEAQLAEVLAASTRLSDEILAMQARRKGLLS